MKNLLPLLLINHKNEEFASAISINHHVHSLILFVVNKMFLSICEEIRPKN